MTRRAAVLVLFVLASCAKQQSADSVLPSELPGGWKRGSVTAPADSVPDLIRTLGLESSAQTPYEAGTKVLVRAYRMRSDTAAFEVMQKWRQSDGMGLQKGSWFLTANGPDRDQTMAVLTELRRAGQ